MKNKQYEAALQIRSTLEEAFEQIRLSRAAELARSKRFLEAAALLAPGGQIPSKTANLDMLARIAVGLHDFQTARKCWQHASRIAPDNPAFAEYLRELERARKQAELRYKLIGGLFAVTLTALLTLLGLMIFQRIASSGGRWSVPHDTQSTALPSKPTPVHKSTGSSPPKNDEVAPLR